MRCIPRAKVQKNRPGQRTAGYRWPVCGNNFLYLRAASHAPAAGSPTGRLRGKQSLHYPGGKRLPGILPRLKGRFARRNGPNGMARRPLLRRKAAHAANRWPPGRYAGAAEAAKKHTKLRPALSMKTRKRAAPWPAQPFSSILLFYLSSFNQGSSRTLSR